MRLTAEERLKAIEDGLPDKLIVKADSRRIAYVLSHIECALEEGISQQAIYQALRRGGLVLAEASFKSTLSRARSRARSIKRTPDSIPQAEGQDKGSKGDDVGKNQFEDYMGELEASGYTDDHNAKFRKRREKASKK